MAIAAAGTSGLDRELHELEPELWADALEHLSDSNPLLPFREQLATGLHGIAGHSHAATSETLRQLQPPHGTSAPPVTVAAGAPSSDVHPSPEAAKPTPAEVALLVRYIGDDSGVSDPAVALRSASGGSGVSVSRAYSGTSTVKSYRTG